MTKAFNTPRVAAYALLGILVPLAATAQFLTEPKTIEHNPPPLSFFEDCVFVCIDIQDGGGEPVTSIPKIWQDMGYTVETCNAASLHYGNVAKPNARRVDRRSRRAVP